MRVIGLTGGIASGKSTVGQMLKDLGVAVIDADELARQVVEPGEPALAEIAQRFPGMLTPEGRLNRSLLGEKIFGAESERLALNAIVHPRIHQLFLEKMRALAASGVDVAVYDAALLIENKLDQRMDGVIVVLVPPEVQVSRLVARSGISSEEAERRVAAQLPLAEKARYATWIVDNSNDLGSTRDQVARVCQAIREGR